MTEETLFHEALANSKPADRPPLLDRLRDWKGDPDLASLRDAGQLRKLPGDDRALLETFWSDLDARLKGTP